MSVVVGGGRVEESGEIEEKGREKLEKAMRSQTG
jgi:hypothetical protein